MSKEELEALEAKRAEKRDVSVLFVGASRVMLVICVCGGAVMV